MLDEATLSTNLLSFAQKNFGYSHRAEIKGQAYDVFHRTETESEAKFRPRLVQLYVVVPAEWLTVEQESEGLEITPPGHQGATSARALAQDVEHEKPEFEAHGVVWKRWAVSDGRWAYVPRDRFSGAKPAQAISALRLPP